MHSGEDVPHLFYCLHETMKKKNDFIETINPLVNINLNQLFWITFNQLIYQFIPNILFISDRNDLAILKPVVDSSLANLLIILVLKCLAFSCSFSLSLKTVSSGHLGVPLCFGPTENSVIVHNYTQWSELQQLLGPIFSMIKSHSQFSWINILL